LIRKDELPKGMMPPETPEKKEPVVLSLADGNYVGAIRKALDVLPVEIKVDKCLVLERNKRPPQVRLTLTILGEKGGDDVERKDTDV
jgi:hypothetical protein